MQHAFYKVWMDLFMKLAFHYKHSCYSVTTWLHTADSFVSNYSSQNVKSQVAELINFCFDLLGQVSSYLKPDFKPKLNPVKPFIR